MAGRLKDKNNIKWKEKYGLTKSSEILGAVYISILREKSLFS